MQLKVKGSSFYATMKNRIIFLDNIMTVYHGSNVKTQDTIQYTEIEYCKHII